MNNQHTALLQWQLTQRYDCLIYSPSLPCRISLPSLRALHDIGLPACTYPTPNTLCALVPHGHALPFQALLEQSIQHQGGVWTHVAHTDVPSQILSGALAAFVETRLVQSRHWSRLGSAFARGDIYSTVRTPGTPVHTVTLTSVSVSGQDGLEVCLGLSYQCYLASPLAALHRHFTGVFRAAYQQGKFLFVGDEEWALEGCGVHAPLSETILEDVRCVVLPTMCPALIQGYGIDPPVEAEKMGQGRQHVLDHWKKKYNVTLPTSDGDHWCAMRFPVGEGEGEGDMDSCSAEDGYVYPSSAVWRSCVVTHRPTTVQPTETIRAFVDGLKGCKVASSVTWDGKKKILAVCVRPLWLVESE